MPRPRRCRFRPRPELMMRTFALDILGCPRCSGRPRLVALMTEPKESARYLRALGTQPTRRREVLRARRRIGRAASFAAVPATSMRPDVPGPNSAPNPAPTRAASTGTRVPHASLLPVVGPDDKLRFTCTYDNTTGNKHVVVGSCIPNGAHLGSPCERVSRTFCRREPGARHRWWFHDHDEQVRRFAEACSSSSTP